MFYYSVPDTSGDGVLFSIDFFVCRPMFVCMYLSFFLCFFVSKITSKRLDRFSWNFQGRCGVTMGRPDYIFWSIPRNRAMPRCATLGRGLLCFHTTACFTCDRSLRLVFSRVCGCRRRSAMRLSRRLVCQLLGFLSDTPPRSVITLPHSVGDGGRAGARAPPLKFGKNIFRTIIM